MTGSTTARRFSHRLIFFRHPTFLSGDENRRVWQHDAMTLVSLIDGHALWDPLNDFADIFRCGRQGMAVVRTSVTAPAHAK
jgi:hypothetical protein